MKLRYVAIKHLRYGAMKQKRPVSLAQPLAMKHLRYGAIRHLPRLLKCQKRPVRN